MKGWKEFWKRWNGEGGDAGHPVFESTDPSDFVTGDGGEDSFPEVSDENFCRLDIIFYGRVQGVGFRFRACQIADELGLTGIVENRDDGTVHMEVQGNLSVIKELVKSLKESSWIEITDTEIRELPVDPKERRFRESGVYY
ncbi:MAG TPA: hypothetical protein DGX96_00240 [Lachnospiraceae bacterium]|jgi:acylphosphatase|nr:hypothetical protein [Lachnospiraceae bacterium]